MNLYQFYITSNNGLAKEPVRILTNSYVSKEELKAMESLKYSEANALCKFRYKTQVLYGHMKE